MTTINEATPHFVQSLVEGNIYELLKNAKAELTKRAEFIIESADKQVILAHARAVSLEEGEDEKITHHLIDSHTGAVVGKYRSAGRARTARDKKDNEYGAYRYRIKPLTLEEMEDQPDNQISPLSKDEVKKMFKNYIRRDDPSDNLDDYEAHTDQAGKDRSGDNEISRMHESVSDSHTHFTIVDGKILAGHDSEEKAKAFANHINKIGYDKPVSAVSRSDSEHNPENKNHWHPFGEVNGIRMKIGKLWESTTPNQENR